MIDEHRETQASLYVLGHLPAAEQREFEQAMLADLELQLLVQALRGTTGKAPFPTTHRSSETDADTRLAWLGWVPWILAGSFALLAVVLLSFGSDLRKENDDLSQRLAEAESAYAELQGQQAVLQQKLTRVETNYVTRIADLQKQVVQRGHDYERQKVELESRNAQANQARKQLAALENQLALNAFELERLNAEIGGVSSLNEDRLAQLRLGLMLPTADGPPAATAGAVYNVAEQKGILVTDGLSALPPDRDYQLWLFDPNVPTPVSGGVFRVGDRGGRIEYRATAQLRSPERFAISIERKGGSAAPQGRFILTSN